VFEEEYFKPPSESMEANLKKITTRPLRILQKDIKKEPQNKFIKNNSRI
jgi:hypothetical protein